MKVHRASDPLCTGGDVRVRKMLLTHRLVVSIVEKDCNHTTEEGQALWWAMVHPADAAAVFLYNRAREGIAGYRFVFQGFRYVSILVLKFLIQQYHLVFFSSLKRPKIQGGSNMTGTICV